MAGPRIVKLAQVLVRYSIPVQAGDWFVIRSSDLAAPLIREVFNEALLVGAHFALGAAYPETGGLNISSLHCGTCCSTCACDRRPSMGCWPARR